MKEILLTIVTTISLLPTLAFARTNNSLFPQPNQKGDYTSILSGKTNIRKSPHLVWKVVSTKLNCRTQAGGNYRIMRLLSQGDNINIVGQPRIHRDKQGKPWLYVAKEGSAQDVKIRCFVRANSQFIQPIPYSLI